MPRVKRYRQAVATVGQQVPVNSLIKELEEHHDAKRNNRHPASDAPSANRAKYIRLILETKNHAGLCVLLSY